MALAPFMPRMDSGMLQDDFFGGLMPFLGTSMMGGPLTGGALATTGTRPLYVDVSEGENRYDLTADVPGVKKENIQLEAEGQILRISVSDDKQDERDETRGGMTWHRVERASSFQQRALRFPDAADLSKVEANVENGVLKVCIAKRQEAQAKRQTIKVA